jgi:hypothetical protein
MGWAENSLTVDDWGVRVGDAEFPLRAFPWGSVTQIRAYVIAAVDGAFSVFELHHGVDAEEVLSTWEDFPAVAVGFSAHLPGIRPDWLNMVQSLPVTVGPVTVWEREPFPGNSLSLPLQKL